MMKNKVKEMREERGWSQGELAKRLNVSRQTVISIEKERYNPSLDLAFSLADLFERRIEDIFTPNRTNEEGIE
ncbi:helix-turn-helix transcriptional regulator [Exiguobacterium acetylicum]|nr:helix-turn-helix transcriptional regulator [Exiguobacterium acetylicum]